MGFPITEFESVTAETLRRRGILVLLLSDFLIPVPVFLAADLRA